MWRWEALLLSSRLPSLLISCSSRVAAALLDCWPWSVSFCFLGLMTALPAFDELLFLKGFPPVGALITQFFPVHSLLRIRRAAAVWRMLRHSLSLCCASSTASHPCSVCICVCSVTFREPQFITEVCTYLKPKLWASFIYLCKEQEGPALPDVKTFWKPYC